MVVIFFIFNPIPPYISIPQGAVDKLPNPSPPAENQKDASKADVKKEAPQQAAPSSANVAPAAAAAKPAGLFTLVCFNLFFFLPSAKKKIPSSCSFFACRFSDADQVRAVVLFSYGHY